MKEIKIFMCLENFVYGPNRSDTPPTFIKGKTYNSEIIDDTIRIIDHNDNWIKFNINSGFHIESFMPNFIELSKCRKLKLEKLCNYAKNI